MFSTSPRSSNYERLEGGMGPGRASRKLAWKKIAVGCAVLIGLVWFFSPRSDGFISDLPTPGLEDIYPPPGTIPLTTRPAASQGDKASPTNAPPSSSPQPIPTSPETDVDPLKTVHCTAPHSPNSPLVQYAVMIDAGSTGSRIHVYKFNNCGPSPAYEYEVFKQITPGLSSYAKSPQGAAESLDVLLEEALRVVPESLRKCAPLAVKATAGLRLLGPQESTDILKAVENHLKNKYPFPLPDEDAVAIMDGKDEGVYAWITANYLLNTIRADSPKSSPPYAVLDLGGGSTQIVFEPERGDEKADAVLKDGEHKYELQFGDATRVLYQHSYLGYGLKSARGSVHRVVEFLDSLRSSRVDVGQLPRISNPCLSQGTTKEVEIPASDGEETKTVLMAGEDVGSFEACNRVLELVMAKDAMCEVKPCSFDGVYQPSLLDAFPSGRILLLSYFYDRLTPLLPSPPNGVQPHLTISTISSLARQVCAGPSTWTQHWGAYPDVLAELQDRPEWCLDLTFMHALLVLGYEFADSRDVELGKRIEGTELGWCLGATIAMVGGKLTCRL
ncbi:hypothetical protein HYDPIDRAFT_170346 [Hydnomerulius pinastri MD-312]|uniref:guanosine-diphosphatase n=1 Tax=Hydnomerulius pinastri MD-312 TaxID=994086 RepID=A0A0C9WA11_9AGAM|nr:hypothetical protein HYDPIDRAFT_170346 [Hydnomerulius pinastri MD-312]